ncbi:hypothetical protein AB0I68_33060 [Streptomyces sp. NPDC050448]|uniref:hypothetical protein n=1 Tax=Streptomyces sp. NPDC050448 TaxID=3155404 RepID=UPI0034181F75
MTDTKVRSALDYCSPVPLPYQSQDVLTIAGIEPSDDRLGATQNDLVCHNPDGDQPYFNTNGTIGPYYVSPQAVVALIGTTDTNQSRMIPADVDELRVVLDKCKQHYPVAPPFSCGPNFYHVDYDSAGVIAGITQLWQS